MLPLCLPRRRGVAGQAIPVGGWPGGRVAENRNSKVENRKWKIETSGGVEFRFQFRISIFELRSSTLEGELFSLWITASLNIKEPFEILLARLPKRKSGRWRRSMTAKRSFPGRL